MSLYTLSIRRPVLAMVMSTVIVLFGLIGFSQLGVREFPAVDPPVITVSTSYRGANTDVIESQITEPLEASINGVDGIRTLTSTSRDGRSTIQAEFALGIPLVVDPDVGIVEVATLDATEHVGPHLEVAPGIDALDLQFGSELDAVPERRLHHRLDLVIDLLYLFLFQVFLFFDDF